jgi:hypothetical protein
MRIIGSVQTCNNCKVSWKLKKRTSKAVIVEYNLSKRESDIYLLSCTEGGRPALAGDL